MNCPNCGHNKRRHNFTAGCMAGNERGLMCLCTNDPTDIELAAWKAEAMAARALLSTVPMPSDIFPNAYLSGFEELRAAYLVARVQDET